MLGLLRKIFSPSDGLSDSECVKIVTAYGEHLEHLQATIRDRMAQTMVNIQNFDGLGDNLMAQHKQEIARIRKERVAALPYPCLSA